jgi:3-oxoacyl-[acyl-carrier protein] reductase
VDVASADLATVAGATAVAGAVRAAGSRCAGVVAAAGGLSPDDGGAAGLDGVRQDWLASFESNVLTSVLLVEALRETVERDGGRVVLLSSVAALIAWLLGPDGGWVTGQVLSPNGGVVLGR